MLSTVTCALLRQSAISPAEITSSSDYGKEVRFSRRRLAIVPALMTVSDIATRKKFEVNKSYIQLSGFAATFGILWGRKGGIRITTEEGKGT
jgi:hypothetical protein